MSIAIILTYGQNTKQKHQAKSATPAKLILELRPGPAYNAAYNGLAAWFLAV